MRTRVAGISFKNEVEDGGKERQHILASLYKSSPRHIITVDLKETTYDGERAIKCFEHKTKQCIGWIPKKDIESVEHSQMTGFINKSKKRFSVALDEQKKPSTKQYQMVKHVCNEMQMTMPAYDTRAYVDIFEMNRKK